VRSCALTAGSTTGRCSPSTPAAHIALRASLAVPQKWGWVQEMYAFTIGLYNAGIKTVDLYLDLMAQPPWDTDYSLNGGWRCARLHVPAWQMQRGVVHGCMYLHGSCRVGLEMLLD
jgi:hypothetical protein